MLKSGTELKVRFITNIYLCENLEECPHRVPGGYSLV